MQKAIVTSILLFTILFSSISYAQPRKGSWMVGTSLTTITPRAGLFVSDNITIGLALKPHLRVSNQFNGGNGNVNISPFIRYYFTNKDGLQNNKFYAYLEGNVGFTPTFNWGDRSAKTSLKNTNAGVGPGVIYFINDRISIDTDLKVVAWSIESQNYELSTNYSIGIQVYLKGKKLEKRLKKIEKKGL